MNHTNNTISLLSYIQMYILYVLTKILKYFCIQYEQEMTEYKISDKKSKQSKKSKGKNTEEYNINSYEITEYAKDIMYLYKEGNNYTLSTFYSTK